MKAGERTTIDGVEFVGLDHGQILLSWYRFLSSERPDWWYWRCAYHLWGAAVEVARLAGVRTIFSTALDRDVYPRHALFWRPRWWPLYAWGLSRTDRIFVQHQGQLSALPKRWQSKAYIVPSIAGEAAIVKSHCEREKYVAWVAVLREVKRPDLLIQIARKMPNIRFVVCGGTSSFASSPGYGERIVNELRLTANIDFRGPVAPEVAQRIIADSAVFLSTSDEEGFPNTFLQAWASGTPVVSLTIDPDLVIKKKRLGTVSRTIEAAVADIQLLIDSPQRREDIALRARRHVADAHSESAAALVFERAIEGRRLFDCNESTCSAV
jgi:glycosyltransferase involved in cell wall biosynthesis